jgi:hypothetical protein
VTVEITRCVVLRAPPPPASARGSGCSKQSPLTPFDHASNDGYIPNVFVRIIMTWSVFQVCLLVSAVIIL